MFRKLLSFEEAKHTLEHSFTPEPKGTERIPLAEAHNRVLAEDITAPMDVPPFDRSTVDGYAVQAQDTFGAEENKPVKLKLSGRVNIGEAPGVTVKRGTVAEIVTGAPLPKGADAVVMLEYVVQESNSVLIHRAVSKGENVMKAGSDIHKGETVLKKGQTLSSREIGALAALGLAEVDMYKRPRVAVLSTGGEVVEAGKKLEHGKIYDVNAHTLSAAVLECGGEPLNLGIIEDEKDRLEDAFRMALRLADVVVSSGGVSVGPKDLVPSILSGLGEPGVIVCGVAVKPGKPLTVALVDGKPVFSLPGHPTSALLMFYLIVRPLLTQMAGKLEEDSLFTVDAIAAEKMFPAKGRRTFVMVNLAPDGAGELKASPVPLGLSGAITTLAKADGFVEIPDGQQFVDAGEPVTVNLFNAENWARGEIGSPRFSLGSFCIFAQPSLLLLACRF